MILVVVKQNGINSEVLLTSVVTYDCSVRFAESTEHFTTNYGLRSYLQFATDNAVREFRNPRSNHDNVGLMMSTKVQDT